MVASEAHTELLLVNDPKECHVCINIPEAPNSQHDVIDDEIPPEPNFTSYVIRSRPKLPNDYRRTIVMMGFVVFSSMCNNFSLAWIHERVPTEAEPLPDIFFSIFPEYPKLVPLTEAFIFTNGILLIGVLVLHKHRLIVARRGFAIIGIAFVGRAICTSLIQLPVPSWNTYCGPKLDHRTPSVIFKRAGYMLITLGVESVSGGRTLCGDLLYSGHTIVLVATALLVLEYAPRLRHAQLATSSSRITADWVARSISSYVGYFACLNAGMGMLTILLSRKHYTIDVVLAYFVVTRLFWNYHASIHHQLVQQEFNDFLQTAPLWPGCEPTLSKYGVEPGIIALPTEPAHVGKKWRLANVVWYPIFTYLEHDVTMSVPNKIKLPGFLNYEKIMEVFSSPVSGR